jgi:hypothetical protein
MSVKSFLEFMALWIGSAAVFTAILGAFAYYSRPFLRKLFWGSASPEDFPRRSTSVR